MSIKKSLRIMLIIFSVLPVIIGSVFTYSYSTKKLLTVQKEKLLQIAETNGSSLNKLIETQKAEVSLLSCQTDITQFVMMNSINFSTYIGYHKAVAELLSERKSLYPSCERIILYDSSMESIASSDANYDVHSYPQYKNILTRMQDAKHSSSIVGEVFYTTDNQIPPYAVEIGMPILNSNGKTILGYIVSTINISYYQDYFYSLSLDKDSFGMIVNRSGKIVSHSNKKLIGQTLKSNQLKRTINSLLQNDKKISDTFIYTEKKSNYTSAYSTIPDLDWVVIITENVSATNGLARINLTIISISTFVILIVAFLISSVFTKLFTRPIFELRDAMREASDGNLDVQCHVSSKNEFGELSKIFNRMLHIIKTSYDDLTSMHELLIANEEELRSNYNHIEFLAYHDVLTNLPNKLAFYDKVDTALSAEPGISLKHAIYFVDLDNFKTINDTLGHDYGDALLTQTAEKLNSLIAPEDILARAGGDEFLLFKYDVSGDDDATCFASNILDTFLLPFYINGEIIYVSMSIGISIYPKNGITHNILIKNADIAMYKSKDTGKNKSTMFDQSMEEELNRNTEILEVLRRAIDNKEVYLMYQPQIETTSKKIIGFEALMRINSQKLGPLSPSEFIPIAEESGLITSLGRWALEEACSFNQSLIANGYPPCVVSVNISSIQLNQKEFVTDLKDILNKTGLQPNYLELEITESTLLSSFLDAKTLVRTFQSIGVRISLDDFGTGYSSLNYLTNLPINTLKIDKSFVDNICINKRDILVAESIINLAHQLHIKVVAEGVEDETQFHLLEARGCDLIQGYVFSRPLLPDILMALLK